MSGSRSSARKAEPLTLAAREPQPLLPNPTIEAFGQALDYIENTSRPSRQPHRGQVGFRRRNAEVILNCSLDQLYILAGSRNSGKPARPGKLLEANVVHQD